MFYLKIASNIHIRPNILWFLCAKEKLKTEEEALFIFLVWLLDPSSEQKTLQKFCLFTCKALQSIPLSETYL